MTEQPDTEKAQRRSAYQNFQSARQWAWSTWTDEAVMIYRRSAHGKTKIRVFLVEVFLFLREMVREFYRAEVGGRAASLAYTTLLSLIPLVVAFSTILGTLFSTLFPNTTGETSEVLNYLVPYRSAQVAAHLKTFADKSSAASTFGIIIFLFICFRLFMAVEATINQMWRIQEIRGYKQKIRAFTMLLFWGPLLITLSFTTSASLERNPYVGGMVTNSFIIAIVPVIVLFIAFTMLFWLVPATKVQIKSAAIGALITAIFFELVRFGFGWYAEFLFTGRLNIVYGTLGLAIIFLISLEVMWIVVLLGVEISYIHQNLEGLLRASEQQLEETPAFDLYFALRALIEITNRFEKREDAPSSYRLAEELGATDGQMLKVLRQLEDAKLVNEIGGDWKGFLPACDPDQITVEEVIEAMEGGSREIPDFDEGDPAKNLVHDVFATMKQCSATALGKQTIGQMVRELYRAPQPSRAGDAVLAPIAD